MPSDVPFIPPFDFHEHVLARWTGTEFHDTALTVGMGFLVAAVCGWIGCYLILQGMALLGDAISHTVLLGIVIAFLMTGQVTGMAMFVGATLTGVATTLLIETLHSTSRVKEDAAIGIVFTSLFALGVVLLGAFAGKAHIDTQHVLYGNLELVASGETVLLRGRDIPVAVVQMAAVAVVVAGLIVAFYKELLVVSFDAQLAASLGLWPRMIRYGMMAVLSLTVVGAFESVGAVLVVAMLIAPAATAYLLTRRLPVMFLYSTLVAGFSSLIGYHLAYWLSVSAAGAMVSAACGSFAAAFLFAPQQGLAAAALRRMRLRLRMQRENIARHMLRPQLDVAKSQSDSGSIGAELGISWFSAAWAVAMLKLRGWIEADDGQPGSLRLTSHGRSQAERLDRAHRLWETYLVEQIGLPSDHVHPIAEEVEHVLSEQLVERVDDVLGHPAVDPHGAPIPRSPIADRAPGTYTLSKLRVGDRARIVGLLDAPDGLAAALTEPDRSVVEVVSLGLNLGQEVELVERSQEPPLWRLELGDGTTREVPHRLADLVLVQLIGAGM
jgi:ABC-type Mn2+/Zn2+ transport system permease subunit/Mn-dependent DtxR family transcriptional regulator